MNNPYTIEELIEKLTQFAASRGWGPQSTTNITLIQSTSGSREVKLLRGDEDDVEDLKGRIEDLEDDLRQQGYDLENVRDERDALKGAVEKLSHEILTLKENARQ